jgi:hypothetical protein
MSSPSTSETDGVYSFHFFLLSLNFISEILAEVIYNLSVVRLGNWKKVKNNNGDDNSTEIRDRTGMFISNRYVLKGYCFRFFNHSTQHTNILFPSSPLYRIVVQFQEVLLSGI